MLFFIVAWTGLSAICFAIGSAILEAVKADCFERDRVIVSVWLGALLLAVSLLATSLVLPLSPLVGSVVAASLVAIAFLSGRVNLALYSNLSLKQGLSFLAVAIGVAAVTTRATIAYDTGLYHFQAIRWLSRFGAVWGLASFHYRLGFTSSWFSLVAPFNAGIFEARIGAFLSGFVLLLATTQFLISAVRILGDRERFEDWFVVTFLFLCLSIAISNELSVSSSTDLPVIFLSGIVSWTILIASQETERSVLDAKLIPLILAAGAVTIKLSALPLLFVSGLFYVFGSSQIWHRLAVASLISVLLLLPMLAFGTVTSGCPLFPSTRICFDLPWSIGEQSTQEVMAGRDWTSQPQRSVNFLLYWWNWLGLQADIVFLVVASIICAFGSWLVNYQVPGQNAVLAIGGLGTLFTVYMAPLLRFGLGYFCLISALFSAICCEIGSPFRIALLVVYAGVMIFTGWYKTGLAVLILVPVIYLSFRLYKKRVAKVFLLLLLLMVARVFLKSYWSSSDRQLHLLLPPQMHSPNQLLSKQVNDVRYVTPPKGEDRCWAAELPCTPSNLETIKLRNPKRGIGAGFVR